MFNRSKPANTSFGNYFNSKDEEFEEGDTGIFQSLVPNVIALVESLLPQIFDVILTVSEVNEISGLFKNIRKKQHSYFEQTTTM
jgi:hypothetical protein